MLAPSNNNNNNKRATTEENDDDAVQSCLANFKRQTTVNLHNAYELDHNKHRAESGTLTTSLVEDVLALLHTESSILSSLLWTEHGVTDPLRHARLWEEGLAHMLREMQRVHLNHKLVFLTTLEGTCAFANDCFRMSERLDELLQSSSISSSLLHPPSSSSSAPLEGGAAEGQAAVALFAQDAVAAAERTQLFILRDVQNTNLPGDLFSRSWEEDWTSNEIADQTVQIFDTYLVRIRRYLHGNDYLYSKAVIMAARALTCFYIRCLVSKADSVTRRRRNRERFHFLAGEKQPFRSYDRALRRMSDDIRLMTGFFREQVDAKICRIIADDMYILELIRECLASTNTDSLESFIVVIHKRTGADLLVTRFFVGDVWMLMNESKPKRSVIRQTFDALQPDLMMVTSGMKEMAPKTTDYSEMSFVRLDDMLKVMYEDRVAQGILPACWTCLPKMEGLEHGEQVVIKPIRKITRKVIELKWNRSRSGGSL